MLDRELFAAKSAPKMPLTVGAQRKRFLMRHILRRYRVQFVILDFPPRESWIRRGLASHAIFASSSCQDARPLPTLSIAHPLRCQRIHVFVVICKRLKKCSTTYKYVATFTELPPLVRLARVKYRGASRELLGYYEMDIPVRPKTALINSQARKSRLGREAWLNAAKAALIDEGIGGVEIDKLARRLNATRGGFYWFFTGRKQVLDLLLRNWEETNSAVFESLLSEGRSSGMGEYKALCDMWVSESGYSPRWDAAIRDWARTVPCVATVVGRVDSARIEIIERIFKHMGFEGTEALVRARVTYFHQVGYYALGLRESHEQRLKLLSCYIRTLTGHEP
jgi:AcrR family transcriptional regulator